MIIKLTNKLVDDYTADWGIVTFKKTYPTPKRVSSKKAWKKRGKK